MTENEIIRAWKEPSYRKSLSQTQISQMPNHPASDSKMDEEMLKGHPETGSFGGTAICSPCPPRHCF